MQRKFDPAQVHRLLSPERQETLDPQRVLSMVPIRHFHTVADVGCGPGYFLIPLAKYLRDGKAIGLDVQPEMLAMAKARVEEARLANTELIQTTADAELSLDPQSVDGAEVKFGEITNVKEVRVFWRDQPFHTRFSQIVIT